MQLKNVINILLIEDESFDVNRVKRTLQPFSKKIVINKVVADGQSAMKALKENKGEFDVIIMDYQIAGALTGERLIQELKIIDSFIQIIVITKMTINLTDFDFANKLIEAGATWFGTKYPSDIKEYIYQPTDLLLAITNAYEKKCLTLEKSQSNDLLNNSIDNILNEKQIIGESEVIKKLKRKIELAAQQEVTVLITGASGTGKELVATNIHYLSKRKFNNIVPVNAGGLPSELIESELFGFEKGSFTGASSKKKGLFELANNGTLFLDEIGELPMSSQVKLLRVLQEGELEKIGRTKKVKVNVRIIAATNIDLENAVEKKEFRSDLFYRLNVVQIYVPTLKERIEDLPVLIDHFLFKYSKEMSISRPVISDDAIEILQSYDWPGNIRQLQNVIQRLLFLGLNIISPEDISEVLRLKNVTSLKLPEFRFGNDILKWKEMEEIFRIKYIQYVKNKSKTDSEAARSLGLAPSNFYRLCSKLGIR